jgi:ferrous iron transport protein B
MSVTAQNATAADVADSILDIALTGNPNAGKTTVFNALTGLRQKVGNYPGVTVEKVTGLMQSKGGGPKLRLHDLPGLYSLVPKSLDDKIAADILFGRAAHALELSLVVAVIDAGNLERNLYLATQIVELGLPTLLVLNMMDVAEDQGLDINIAELERQLGVPVMPLVASKGKGIAELRARIFEMVGTKSRPPEQPCLEMDELTAGALQPVRQWLASHSHLTERARCAEALRICSNDRALEGWQHRLDGARISNFETLQDYVAAARKELGKAEIAWNSLEPQLRYRRIDKICRQAVSHPQTTKASFSERADRVLTHKIAGPIIFILIFGAIFQSIFAWAQIPMDAIEQFIAWLGMRISEIMPKGVLQDLIVNGAIAGVGAIMVFLPQILFLFFFLSLLEDTGYMARAAFIMDRFMRGVGLSGRAVIPLLSSFACAIPGIMATRTINNSRDRLITILIAPFMSCSARLPIYALMIGAFIPNLIIMGIFTLPGLVLLAMYMLGILAAVAVALVLKRFMRPGTKPSIFVMELPPYRLPSLKWTSLQMLERGKIFVTDAGKIILAISIVLWFLASFPKPTTEMNSAAAIRQSYAGRLGHMIEPVIEPLGFDWKMGIAIITSFAAREVMVSTLATIYNVEGADESSHTLRETLRNERHRDTGLPVYTPLVAISLMVFYVLACQCMSTVAIVKRETNSWRWPVTMVVYMTTMAYLGSLAVYQGGKLFGLG